MAKCKCGKCCKRARISSNVVQKMKKPCFDICTTPICGTPKMLSLFAPLIYDEIGINLCTTFTLEGADFPTNFPTATNAIASVVSLNYANGADGVEVENISGRPNCYAVSMTDITVQFALRIFDDSCRYLTTLYPTAVYLPSSEEADTFNEETNPSSAELEIFAPYGPAYEPGTPPATPTPIVNPVGFLSTQQGERQGLNLYAIPKVLNLNTEENEVTIGVTFVLQSLYYAGYQVRSHGRVETPKGDIDAPDETECKQFVDGKLLELEIKPLVLGEPFYEEKLKQDCDKEACGSCIKLNGECPCESMNTEEEIMEMVDIDNE